MRIGLASACVLSVAASPLALAAQTMNLGPGGVHDGGPEIIVHAPEPVQAGRELEMSELTVQQSAPLFFLNFGTSGRSGPFELADGATVGSKQNPYTLRLADYGSRFTLTPANTNTTFGPFTATNGAPVTLGNNLLTVLRVPPELTVSLSHPNRIAQMPLIGIAPLSPGVVQALYDLRAKYVALANRVDRDTADVEFQGVPRIHSGITGNTFTPVVKTSGRDKQNALKGAELTGIGFLEKTFSQAFSIRSQAITEGSTYHFRLPAAGDYVLCATQRVKDPKAGSAAGFTTVVWWTPLHFDGERPLALALTADNAITWREIFSFDKKR